MALCHLLESDLADHYHHLIRYQSSSFFDYTRKRLVVISKFFTQDLFVWFLGLLPLGIHFKTVALFFLLAQLMMLYLLLSYLIALISAGAGFSFFLFFSICGTRMDDGSYCNSVFSTLKFISYVDC